MVGLRDYVLLDYPGSGSDANYRFPIVGKSAADGIAPPYVPRFSPGAKGFTGGTPPVETKGQRLWGGLNQKYAKDADNRDFRSGFNVSTEFPDRLMLARAWSGTVYNTAKDEVRLAKQPFKDVYVAYSVTSNDVWTKSGSGAWAAATIPATGSGTAITGWLSDCVAKLSGVPYLLLGSAAGHVYKFDGTTWTEVGRPTSTGAPTGGIYAMEVFNSVLHLAGADGSGATLGTYDGSSFVKKFGYEDFNGQARVQTLLARYVDQDNTKSQLHLTTLRSANGYEAWHFMYDGTDLIPLKRWADNAPLSAVEVDVTGARAVFFGMAKRGEIWRYTGDYAMVQQLENPDAGTYAFGIPQLCQWGRFLCAPIVDAVNGCSILRFDGDHWWQDACLGSSYVADVSGIGVYRETVFLVHKASGASRIFELLTGANYATSGKLVTSLEDGGYREIDKKWVSVVAQHAALASGESVQLEYALDDGGTTRAFLEDFAGTSYRDLALTTAVWDTLNRRGSVRGYSERNYVGKVTGSVTASKHVAYQGRKLSDPTVATPGSLIAAFSEFDQSQYDAVEADDASAALTSTTAGTLDQSATTKTNGNYQPPGASWLCQTFRAGASATLSAVLLNLTSASGTQVVRVRLYATSGGVPSGASLATSASVSVSGANADVTFLFESPYSLVNATTYALVVELVSGTGLYVYGSAASVYANGQGGSYNSGTGVFSAFSAPADLYFKTYKSGTSGYCVQLYQFDLSEYDPDDLVGISAKLIAYGSDSTGAANGGCHAYVWDADGLAWTALGNNTAVEATADAGKTISTTITSSPSSYVDVSSKVHVLLVGDYSGTNALAAKVACDLSLLPAYYDTAAEVLSSREVDTVASGAIATATLTATTSGGGTIVFEMSADNGTTWESCTSGVLKTFATSGNQLKWRATLTAASATASPPIVSRVVITYAATAYVSLGTNSTLGSIRTAYSIGATVVSKLINLRLSLVGGGSSTPQVFSLKLDFVVKPDPKRAFWAEVRLEKGYQYSDGQIEERTPAEMAAQLLALITAKSCPRLDWIDGTSISQVEFLSGAWRAQRRGVPAEADDEHFELLPLALAEVAA